MKCVYRSEEGKRLVLERYSKFLERWTVPSQQVRLCTREGETFVVACGPEDAPPLLLFHGAAGNAAMWMADVAAWAAHFRVYAVDMIGEAGFSAPSRPPLTSDAYAVWLDDVLRGLSLERVSIVGESLGGWLALDYATRRPDRVSSLALLCPAGIGRQKMGFFFKVLLLRMCGPWGLRKLRESFFGGMTKGVHPAVQRFLDFFALIHEHFRPRMGKIPRFKDATLQKLAIPVLAIMGGKDVLLNSAETKRRLQRNVPHAEIRYLEDKGHVLPRQTGPILDFLRSQAAREAGTTSGRLAREMPPRLGLGRDG